MFGRPTNYTNILFFKKGNDLVENKVSRNVVSLALIFHSPRWNINVQEKELQEEYLICFRQFCLHFYFRINIVVFIQTLHSIG